LYLDLKIVPKVYTSTECKKQSRRKISRTIAYFHQIYTADLYTVDKSGYISANFLTIFSLILL